MFYHRIPHSSLEVSMLGLGTMTFGEQNSEAQAHDQLALANGVNLIDTAEMYPVPPRPETQGLTERYIGSWLKRRGQREKIVLASKVLIPARGNDLEVWPQQMLDRKNIRQALEDSLRRLNTDYLDLYQVHWPQRSTNCFGKLNYRYTDEKRLLNRSFEVGMAEISQFEGLELLAYSSLAFGTLSGKYLHGARPAGTRNTLFSRFTRYSASHTQAAITEYVALANRHGLDPAQMALAFVRRQLFVASTLLGATPLEQLQSNLDSLTLDLDETLLASLEEIHGRYTFPAP